MAGMHARMSTPEISESAQYVSGTRSPTLRVRNLCSKRESLPRALPLTCDVFDNKIRSNYTSNASKYAQLFALVLAVSKLVQSLAISGSVGPSCRLVSLV